MDRGVWQATVHGITRVRYNLVLSFFISKRFFSSSSLLAIRVVCADMCISEVIDISTGNFDSSL